jgi:hypothetical protein
MAGQSLERTILPSGDERWAARAGAKAPAPAEEEPHSRRVRFLTGILPERAPVGARLSLLVMIALQRGASPSEPLKGFPVPRRGPA